jgi:hypothetical protein
MRGLHQHRRFGEHGRLAHGRRRDLSRQRGAIVVGCLDAARELRGFGREHVDAERLHVEPLHVERLAGDVDEQLRHALVVERRERRFLERLERLERRVRMLRVDAVLLQRSLRRVYRQQPVPREPGLRPRLRPDR